jgi:hypothetical protein
MAVHLFWIIERLVFSPFKALVGLSTAGHIYSISRTGSRKGQGRVGLKHFIPPELA